MITALVFISSGILIGAGIHILWREFRSYRRDSFIAGLEVPSARARETEVEVLVSRRGGSQLASAKRLREEKGAPGSALHELEHTLSQITVDAAEADDVDATASTRLPEIERNWSVLQPCINEGIDKISNVLTSVGLAIAAAGDPVWRIGNKGFGIYRRLLLNGESIGWLRIELSADNQLHVTVRAHRGHQAQLNTTAKAPVLGMTSARVSDVLAECLMPAAVYAAWIASKQAAERRSNDETWEATEPIIQAALDIASATVRDAGARLVPLGAAAWDPELRCHRLVLSVEVDGASAARLLLGKIASDLEIAVELPDVSLAELGRRCRVEMAGITAGALAEAIKGSVLPAIVHARKPQILA